MHEPLVFLPGLMCDARLFLPQMVLLGERWSCRSIGRGLPPIWAGNCLRVVIQTSRLWR